MVDRNKRRLLDWKANYLSKGMMTLIKAAMANILIYFISLLNIPKHITLTIEKHQQEFMWKDGDDSSNMHLIAWETVCSSKAKGGLGIYKLVDMNVAPLSK